MGVVEVGIEESDQTVLAEQRVHVSWIVGGGEREYRAQRRDQYPETTQGPQIEKPARFANQQGERDRDECRQQ